MATGAWTFINFKHKTSECCETFILDKPTTLGQRTGRQTRARMTRLLLSLVRIVLVVVVAAGRVARGMLVASEMGGLYLYPVALHRGPLAGRRLFSLCCHRRLLSIVPAGRGPWNNGNRQGQQCTGDDEKGDRLMHPEGLRSSDSGAVGLPCITGSACDRSIVIGPRRGKSNALS